VDLQEQGCVLEIGRQTFSVTYITRETVRFRLERLPVACGRATGLLDFGGGVSFAVSGTVGIAGNGQGVLCGVRVVPSDTPCEEHFQVAEAGCPSPGRHPIPGYA